MFLEGFNAILCSTPLKLPTSSPPVFLVVMCPWVFSFCLFIVDHSCKGCTGVSEWPDWTFSPSLNPAIYPSHLLSSRQHADPVACLVGPAVSGLGSRQLGLHHHQGSGPEGSHPERPQKHPAQHYPHHD